jgi:hypothetical protein
VQQKSMSFELFLFVTLLAKCAMMMMMTGGVVCGSIGLAHPSPLFM